MEIPLKIYFDIMCMNVYMHACLHVMCVPGTHRHREDNEFLESEVIDVGKLQVMRTKPGSFARAMSTLNPRTITLATSSVVCFCFLN